MFFVDHFLSLLVFLPVVLAILLSILPLKDKAVHGFGIAGAALLFGLSLLPWLVHGFVPNTEMYSIFPSMGVHYALGADGLSWTLVVLTTFLLLMSSIASLTTIQGREKLYYGMLFLLVTAVLGVFTARDLFLYFLFWELELIPMYLLIAIWGGPRRQFAAMKFVLYTLFGSIFLVAALVGLYLIVTQGTHALPSMAFLYDTVTQEVQNGHIPLAIQVLLFLGFFITFAVKLPMVPFHTWLPDAHVEAPTPVSMMLAGIMLKMGAYGMLRLCFGFFPEAAHVMAPYIAILALVNIVYTAGVALIQTDMKKLIAYSSVSHMGFVLLGLASLNAIGYNGATFVMVSHGIVSAALFMCVGTLYHRTHTRDISQYGGFGAKTPTIFYFFLLMSMASLGLPLLISFAGESLVFYGAYLSKAFEQIVLPGSLILPWNIQAIALLSAVGVILGAAYSLWLMKRLFYGEENANWGFIPDASRSEVVVLGTLTVLVLIFGFQPGWLTRLFEASVSPLAPSVEAVQASVPTPSPPLLRGGQS